jgi:type 1 glutamine amidotransferase/nicotinamidase-related amidase
MTRLSICFFTFALGTLLPLAAADTQLDADTASTLKLFTRYRAADPESGEFAIKYQTIQWDAAKTAVVICDMWTRHWCEGACKRGAEIAPRINEFVKVARNKGALIIHAPSGGMAHYADHPARERAKSAPRAANLPDGIAGWCRGIESEEQGQWPVDQEDGGCDDQPRCVQREMDLRQAAAIEIHAEDAISDSGVEIWNLYEQRGIENVILVGVHTNMCVIGRPFGLRNMVRFGKRVLLVRDLTDTMYNPRSRPFVSHVRGTELVVEHIEKYVCPTITSTNLLDKPAVRFTEDTRPHVAFLVSDDHYDADKTLPAFAQTLRERYGVHCSVLHGQGKGDIPVTAELESADCLVLFIRRLAFPKYQLDRVRRYLDSGQPLVAMRTASHAFDVRGQSKEGEDEWPEFDPQVLGGNYQGHGPNALGSDVAVVPDQADHPLMQDVQPAQWHSVGSLYFTAPVAANATVLQTGSIEDRTEPLTWIRQYDRGRVFYTGLGHPDDFDKPQFKKLLINAIFWAMDRSVPDPSS